MGIPGSGLGVPGSPLGRGFGGSCVQFGVPVSPLGVPVSNLGSLSSLWVVSVLPISHFRVSRFWGANRGLPHFWGAHGGLPIFGVLTGVSPQARPGCRLGGAGRSSRWATGGPWGCWGGPCPPPWPSCTGAGACCSEGGRPWRHGCNRYGAPMGAGGAQAGWGDSGGAGETVWVLWVLGGVVWVLWVLGCPMGAGRSHGCWRDSVGPVSAGWSHGCWGDSVGPVGAGSLGVPGCWGHSVALGALMGAGGHSVALGAPMGAGGSHGCCPSLPPARRAAGEAA